MTVWPLSFLYGDDSRAGAGEPERPSEELEEAKSPSSPLDLLPHFQGPGIALPPSSRVGDPKLKQRVRQSLKPWELWKFGVFAAKKAAYLVADIASYELSGPKRPSWGIEMTLVHSIMRDVGSHSHLADLAMIRMLMGIGGYVPVPSDALVTPVTFRVRKRKLRGILEEFDAAEDGTRELSGEWVVGKRTWQRQQQAWKAAKKAGAASEKTSSQEHHRKERVVLYLHGGAYYVSSPATHRLITIPLAKALDARLFALDYRLAPETCFPGPLHDAVSAYFRLTDDLHIPPENIIVSGDSAGGGLSLALMMYLRDNDYSIPSSAILFSPWVDLTLSCDSWESNADYDYVPMPQPGDHLNPIACYLGEHMEKYLTHPYASPLFGDLKGLPPLLIQAGECEVLRDEITLLAHKATLAGVEVRHELYEDCTHVFQSLPFVEASTRAFVSCRHFVRDFLPQWQSRSPQELEGSAELGLAKEIDTSNARVVRGDGIESGVAFDASSDDEALSDRGRTAQRGERNISPTPSQEEYPSWAPKQPTLPTTPESDKPVPLKRRHSQQYTTHKRADFESPTPAGRPPASLRRLQSTVSLIAHESFRSASDQLRITAEQQSQDASSGDEVSRRLTKNRSRKSSLSMFTNVPAPKPSIRRTDTSHPDITQLCHDYATSGPAHQTMTFKPEPESVRARSKTLSVSLSSDSRRT